MDYVRRLAHSRATYKQLVKELGSRGVSRDDLDHWIGLLLERGELIEYRRDHYVAAGASREYTTGSVRVHRDGFGFLVPEKRPEGLDGDVFLPPPEAAKAMHGDRALVRINRFGRDGRAEGEVLKILKRAHATVVGEFLVRRHGHFVKPHDTRISALIEIPPGLEVPPRELQTDRLGLDAAKPAAPLTPEDLDGQIVNVEILEFPEDDENGVGRVIEILGHPDDFGVDVEVMIRKHHLPHRFPAEVIAEAQAIPSTVPDDEIARRRDFRSFDIVTIDGENARDFDDAVWVDQLPNGHWTLQVHIADVSHYVRPGSAIDHEAALRGTSVYFPDRAVPMLPVELSTDICSLRPQVDRLVMSAILELDPLGEIVHQDFCSGVIRSRERMTYTHVHALLEGEASPELRARYAPLQKRFELMKDLALILNRKRVRRGSIDFDLPEPLIEFDQFGEMTGVTRSPRNIAHRLIEELMLAANESVASHLEKLGIPSLYRIHETPDPKRVAEFEQIAAHYGVSLGLGGVPMKKIHAVQKTRDGRKLRKDMQVPDAGFQVNSRAYQKLIAKIEGKPEERILSYLMLRSLKQARYSEDNTGHFALAAPTYTHFTSPIRRYPDLVVHRVLRAQLEGGRRAYDEPRLREIADDTSFTERRAGEAERELVEWKKAKFMIDRVGDEFPAMIISVQKFGFFVELESLFVEGLVPIETLRWDRFQFHEGQRRLIGERTRKQFSIGDRVNVRLDRVDATEGRLNFSVLNASASNGGGSKRERSKPNR